MNWSAKSSTGNEFKFILKSHFLNFLNWIRLKKIQDKKRIARVKAEAIKAAKKAQGIYDDEEASNMLDDGHDEDVLF